MGETDPSQNDTEPPGQNKSTHISQYNNTITNRAARAARDPQTLKQTVSQSVGTFVSHSLFSVLEEICGYKRVCMRSVG